MTAALLLVALLLTPSLAHADTVFLDSGALTLVVDAGNHGQSYNGQIFHATGPGLTIDLTGGVGTGPGCVEPFPGGGCQAGQQYIIQHADTSATVKGTVVYQGFSFIGSAGALGEWDINGGPLTFPLVSPSGFTASTPFTLQFNGHLCPTGGPGALCPTPAVQLTAIGQGQATFSFIPDSQTPGGLPGRWSLTSGVFQITAVPEPSTWLLAGTGLGLLGLVRLGRWLRRG